MRPWLWAGVAVVGAAAAWAAVGAFALPPDDDGDPPADAAEAKKAEDAARKEGEKAFHDKALSTNDKACATCHEKPRKPEMVLKGVATRFPRFDRNARRVITLQEKFAQMQERMLKNPKTIPLGDARWTALELYLKSL